MSFYTYKVVPAPSKAPKLPGVKAPEARFALGLEGAINDMASQGWEYLRADILPSEERQGLTSTHTVYRSVLIFRRAVEAEAPPVASEESAHPTAPAVHLPEAGRSAPALGAAAFAAEAGDSLRRTPPLKATPPEQDAPSQHETFQDHDADAQPGAAPWPQPDAESDTISLTDTDNPEPAPDDDAPRSG